MAEDGIKFDPAMVSSKAASIKNVLDRLNAKVTTMKTQVENLPSSWSGDEADRFKTKIENFMSNFDKFTKEMNEYVAFLEGVSSTYSALESEIISSASAIK